MANFLEELIEDSCASLREGIISNVSGIFDSVNEHTASAGLELSKTPQGWNGNIFSMIQNISDTVILPIAGMILTFIMCYEIISLITDKNNMHEVETFMFFKIILKMGIGVYVLSHSMEFVMAFFDVAQNVISRAMGIVVVDGSLEFDNTLVENLDEIKNIMELVKIWAMSFLMQFAMKIIGIAVTIALYGRFIEIYLYISVAPIPLATFANREWGQIGNNYVRGLMALGFQGFFMLICIAVYSALVQGLVTDPDIMNTLLESAAYTVLLVLALFKTSQISKSIFNAH